MKRRKWTALILAGVLACSLTACGGNSDAGTTSAGTPAPASTAASGSTENGGTTTGGGEGAYGGLEELTMIVASSASSSLNTFTLQQQCADAIKEKTGGKLNFDLNWDGILGDDAVLTENCIAGSIPVVSLMSSALVNYVPEVGVFDCPAVFDSEEAAYQGVAAMKETLDPIFAEKGLVILGMGFQTFRALSTNRNLQKVEDFQGMSIRTLENKYHMAFWNNLGSVATPLAFSDLYLSLQQGLVEAQDNTAPAVYSNKFYEVQDYYMAVPAFMNVALVVGSKTVYDSLDPAYQECLMEFGANYVQAAYDSGSSDIKEALDKMKDDLTVLPVTDDMLAAFKTAAKPIWDDVAAALGDDIVNRYLGTAGITR